LSPVEYGITEQQNMDLMKCSRGKGHFSEGEIKQGASVVTQLIRVHLKQAPCGVVGIKFSWYSSTMITKQEQQFSKELVN